MSFTLNITNSNDLPDIIFQGTPTFAVQFIIDERHFVQYINIVPDIKENIIEEQGKEHIESMNFMQQKELSFLIDADGARFLSRLKLFDTFTYTDYRGEAITPDEWDIKVDPPNESLDTHYKKVTITIKINFFTKVANQVNFTDVTTPDTKPTATGVNVSGVNTVGSTLTGNYTYVTNGGAEGTSEYRWFRADDAFGTNKQLISGETTTSYVVATADLNKWITFQVKPVSVAVILEGDWTESSYFAIESNIAPVAQGVDLDTHTPEVGVLVTGEYTYFDADGDLEDTGALVNGWFVADDVYGLNDTKISGASLTYTPIFALVGKFLRWEIKPIALTGVLDGIFTTSSYYEIQVAPP